MLSIFKVGVCVFWQALGCPVEVPTVSICQLLDQLINLFSFYNGSIDLSYKVSCFVESTLFISTITVFVHKIPKMLCCNVIFVSTEKYYCISYVSVLRPLVAGVGVAYDLHPSINKHVGRSETHINKLLVYRREAAGNNSVFFFLASQSGRLSCSLGSVSFSPPVEFHRPSPHLQLPKDHRLH